MCCLMKSSIKKLFNFFNWSVSRAHHTLLQQKVILKGMKTVNVNPISSSIRHHFKIFMQNDIINHITTYNIYDSTKWG